MARTAPHRRSRRKVVWNYGVAWGAPILTFIALLVLWHFATVVFDWQEFLVPSPLAVAEALSDNRSLIPENAWITVQETLAGYFLAIAIAVPIAILTVYSRFIERTIYPILLALQSVPKIALAPILLLWMGFGVWPKIVMTILICFFPIVISTATGLKSTPPEFIELIRSLSASEFDIFRRIRFPAALPHIFVGLKVAISLAVIGAVIGEFVGADKGLGWLIINSEQNINTALAFAAMALLSVISIVLFYAVAALERILVPWARTETE